MDKNNSKSTAKSETNPEIKSPPEKLNLWQFSRMYKVYDIPITDFVIVYVILYCLNHLYPIDGFKLVFIMTIPITIIFNMLTNPEITMKSSTVFFVIIILLIAYFTAYHTGPES